MKIRLARPPRLRGELTLPGDKSISHRALILNAVAQGRAHLRRLSLGGDCRATLRCLRALGVRLEGEGEEVLVHGSGGVLREPAEVLDAGNSGTTMRLLAGVLAGQPFFSVLSGDESLNRRPMGRIVEPLSRMGARISGRVGDTCAPLAIRGGGLKGIEYRTPVASAQVKSAILLAGLFAEGETRVQEPVASRDHTERLLARMGAGVTVEGAAVTLRPPAGGLEAVDVAVPGDISSAAYLLVAAVAHGDASLRLRDVGVNPGRSGVLDALQQMGARLSVENQREVSGEPVADVLVESSELRAIEIGGELVPRLIDEIPVLCLAAACAEGTTIVRNAAELRVKESDRVASTARQLARLGVAIEERPDGMVVHGRGRSRLCGARCHSEGDHRLALTLGVAGVLAEGETVVEGAEAAQVSYPGFWEQLEALTASGVAVG